MPLACGHETPPALLRSLPVGVEEEVELELGRGAHVVPSLRSPLDLTTEHASRRDLDRLSLHGQEIAEDDGTSRLPWQSSDGGGVDHRPEVAVATLPVGEAVAGEWLHVDVTGEQVVADLDAVGGHVVEEEPTGDPLADRAPLEVGEGDDDRVEGDPR